ncbi:glycosyltransferase [Flavobacterium sp. 140616W15]|uniref:glycosyltransferase n=1 Tax=Flavobacterium sp. 140616W15 TaxID=2478552 RepID=UPI000F0CAB92|nr:glycosyltransferase [Flavobacterium sp. 140616W15]AYN05204.1 glycosyltransferase [Flavobacterium sp. 140616W15]
MKILIVITDYGSFNNFLAEISVALSLENEIHIICSRSNVINIVDKFDYTQYDLTFHFLDIPRTTSITKLIKSSFRIRKLVKEIKPNLVYAHFTTGIFPVILLRNKNVEYWGTFHGLGMNASTGLRKIMFSFVEMFSFIRLDKIFLINNKDFDLVKRFFSNKANKYQSCGVGCNIDKFDGNKFQESDKENIRKDLKLESKFIITYTGRFVEFKGFDLVFHSFAKLIKEYPNEFALLLVGGKDPIHITGLTLNEEGDLNNNKSIINIGYTSEVEKYLAISDVFLFPSKKEGLPVCIVESLAMGVPVITLDERGNSDIVKNNFNGYLIKSVSKSNDANEIVEKLKYLNEENHALKILSSNCMLDREIYSRSFFVQEQLSLINDFKKQNKLD